MSNHYFSKDLGTRVIKINHKDVEIKLEVKLYPEYDEFDCEPEEEKIKINKEINEGLIDHAVVAVEARALGEIGGDCLGSVLIGKPQDLDEAINENDMIETAINCLKDNLKDKYETLHKIFGA